MKARRPTTTTIRLNAEEAPYYGAMFWFIAYHFPKPTIVAVQAENDRPPTEAEFAFVRARARQAARAMFDEEQSDSGRAARSDVRDRR